MLCGAVLRRGMHVWAYEIRVSMDATSTLSRAQLVNRRWEVHGDGKVEVVRCKRYGNNPRGLSFVQLVPRCIESIVLTDVRVVGVSLRCLWCFACYYRVTGASLVCRVAGGGSWSHRSDTNHRARTAHRVFVL